MIIPASEARYLAGRVGSDHNIKARSQGKLQIGAIVSEKREFRLPRAADFENMAGSGFYWKPIKKQIVNNTETGRNS